MHNKAKYRYECEKTKAKGEPRFSSSIFCVEVVSSFNRQKHCETDLDGKGEKNKPIVRPFFHVFQ